MLHCQIHVQEDIKHFKFFCKAVNFIIVNDFVLGPNQDMVDERHHLDPLEDGLGVPKTFHYFLFDRRREVFLVITQIELHVLVGLLQSFHDFIFYLGDVIMR